MGWNYGNNDNEYPTPGAVSRSLLNTIAAQLEPTDRCGIVDVINGQAWLVVPYDKDQPRDALLHMLSDDQMRLRFGEKGKLLVREKFNWEKIAEQVEGVYRGVQHG